MGECFENVQSIHVKAEGGTDVFIPVKGRKLLNDDGDFSKPGSGGNIPAGEVFISPVVGCGNGSDKVPEENYACADGTSGVIVFDGSMTFSDGDSILETPIKCVVASDAADECVSYALVHGCVVVDVRRAEKPWTCAGVLFYEFVGASDLFLHIFSRES